MKGEEQSEKGEQDGRNLTLPPTKSTQSGIQSRINLAITMADGSSGNDNDEKPSISGSVTEALTVSQEVVHGSDSEGRKYSTIAEMWSSEGVSNGGNTSSWYARASEYYEENCPASLDGVLGGFGSISNLDLEGSKKFLESFKRSVPRWIGRRELVASVEQESVE